MVERIKWDIRRAGRAWRGDEAHERYNRTPEKFEMVEGRLFWTDEERVTLLALLLENVGVDRAVRLGDSEVWKAARATYCSVWCRALPGEVPAPRATDVGDAPLMVVITIAAFPSWHLLPPIGARVIEERLVGIAVTTGSASEDGGWRSRVAPCPRSKRRT